MTDSGSATRQWLLATTVLSSLILAGLVLSYFLWNRLESSPAMPCAQGDDRWQSAALALGHAAALLSEDAPEMELTPAHIFQFPFDFLCIARHGEDDAELLARLGVAWDCASAWEREVLANDAFLSLIAVAGDEIIPVRINRAEFDVSGDIPARISPQTAMILHKRTGSDQVLIRFP